jgi:hypothetical protein
MQPVRTEANRYETRVAYCAIGYCGARTALFESHIMDKKLDVVRPCKGMIAEGKFHRR